MSNGRVERVELILLTDASEFSPKANLATSQNRTVASFNSFWGNLGHSTRAIVTPIVTPKALAAKYWTNQERAPNVLNPPATGDLVSEGWFDDRVVSASCCGEDYHREITPLHRHPARGLFYRTVD